MTVSFHLIFSVLCALSGVYLLWKIPSFARCERGDSPKHHSSVSVIIPARNEQTRLGPLLASLQEQTLPPDEVLVVDDHSTDGTAALAETMGAAVASGQALPPGWTGKTWACWQGAQRTRGEVLVFLDADVRLERHSLACLLDAFDKQGGLLTVQPYHVTCKPYEELSAVFNLVLMAGLNAFTPQGERLTPSGAFGPCAVCSRQSYQETGGHGHPAVRGAILESIPLSRVFLDHGLPVRCYGGRGGISFRMYPGGFGDLIEGWTKGFGSGAMAVRPVFLLLVVAWISAGFGVFINLTGALASPLRPLLLLDVLIYALYAVQLWWMLHRIGSFRWWTAALFPVPLCFFALVMLRSFVLIHLLGRVEWRGRAVPTARREGRR